jgi:hypothetical protein
VYYRLGAVRLINVLFEILCRLASLTMMLISETKPVL